MTERSTDDDVYGGLTDGIQADCLKWVSYTAESGLTHKHLSGLLRQVRHRRGTLFLLLLLEPRMRQLVFPDLVDLASVGHADIDLCRTVIKSLPLEWVRERIWTAARVVLEKDINDDEAFQRYAEFFSELDRSLLGPLLELAKASKSDEVQDVYHRYIKHLNNTD
jgi:hypothetical protein